MACIAFEITDEGKKYKVENMVGFELTKDAEAACDGLRLKFIADEKPDEIISVTAFIDGEKVFFGYCDTQRTERTNNGFEVFVYARSSACILVDNEAQPAIYNSPSAKAIFIREAEKFGFKNGLDELCCKYSYTVPKGSSCFGAINDFVRVLTSKSIAVSPENVIYLPASNGTASFTKNDVISEKHIINRGQPISKIDYKLDCDEGYTRHFESRNLLKKGISKSRKINISALPAWQREYALKNRLKKASSGYISAEIVLSGVNYFNLYDRVEYDSPTEGELDGYVIKGVCVSQEDSTASTRLLLEKPVELKEVNYVAK